MDCSFVRRSKTKYGSSDGSTRLTLAVSREYRKTSGVGFWYAFHAAQKEFLSDAKNAYAAFGGGSAKRVFLIPFKDFLTFLPKFHVTDDGKRHYWHVRIVVDEDGPRLITSKGHRAINVSKYVI